MTTAADTLNLVNSLYGIAIQTRDLRESMLDVAAIYDALDITIPNDTTPIPYTKLQGNHAHLFVAAMKEMYPELNSPVFDAMIDLVEGG